MKDVIHIQVGKDALDTIYEYLEEGAGAVHAIGLKVDTYGGENYFHTIQMTFNTLGFAVVEDGKFVEDNVPIVNAYKSICDKSLIIETDDNRFVLNEYKSVVMKHN